MATPNIYVWLDQNSYLCEFTGPSPLKFLTKEQAALSRCDCGDPLLSGSACGRRGSQAVTCVKMPELCMREYAILFTPTENRLMQPFTTEATTTRPTTTSPIPRTTRPFIPLQQRQQSQQNRFNKRPQPLSQRRPPPFGRQNQQFFTLAPRQGQQTQFQNRIRGRLEQNIPLRATTRGFRNRQQRPFAPLLPSTQQQFVRNRQFRPAAQPPRPNPTRASPPPTATRRPTTTTTTTSTTTPATTTTTTRRATTTTTTPTTTTTTTTRPTTTTSTTTTTTTTTPAATTTTTPVTITPLTTTTSPSTTTSTPVNTLVLVADAPKMDKKQSVEELVQMLISRLMETGNKDEAGSISALSALLSPKRIPIPMEVTKEVTVTTTKSTFAPTAESDEKAIEMSSDDEGPPVQRIVFSTKMDMNEMDAAPIRIIASSSTTMPTTASTSAPSTDSAKPIVFKQPSSSPQVSPELVIVTDPPQRTTIALKPLRTFKPSHVQLVRSRPRNDEREDSVRISTAVTVLPTESVPMTEKPIEKKLFAPSGIIFPTRHLQQLVPPRIPQTPFERPPTPGTIWASGHQNNNNNVEWERDHSRSLRPVAAVPETDSVTASPAVERKTLVSRISVPVDTVEIHPHSMMTESSKSMTVTSPPIMEPKLLVSERVAPPVQATTTEPVHKWQPTRIQEQVHEDNRQEDIDMMSPMKQMMSSIADWATKKAISNVMAARKQLRHEHEETTTAETLPPETTTMATIPKYTESFLTIGRDGFSAVNLIQQKLEHLENQLMGALTDRLNVLDELDSLERNDINPNFSHRKHSLLSQGESDSRGLIFSVDSPHRTVDKDESPSISSKFNNVQDLHKQINFRTSPFNPKYCEDNHPLCEYWAFYKQCNLNASYMYKYCRKACKICE